MWHFLKQETHICRMTQGSYWQAFVRKAGGRSQQLTRSRPKETQPKCPFTGKQTNTPGISTQRTTIQQRKEMNCDTTTWLHLEIIW